MTCNQTSITIHSPAYTNSLITELISYLWFRYSECKINYIIIQNELSSNYSEVLQLYFMGCHTLKSNEKGDNKG